MKKIIEYDFLLTDRIQKIKSVNELYNLEENAYISFSGEKALPENKIPSCKGCPFNINIEKQLEFMKENMPQEYKQCVDIWKPVYNEYKRINYRFKNRDLFV